MCLAVSNEDHAAAVVSCYSKSSQFLELDGLAASSHAPSESGLVPVSRSRSDAPPLWLQFGVIITRFFRSMMRHPIAFVAELTQYWFMALFVGACRTQLRPPFSPDMRNVMARVGIVNHPAIVATFLSSMLTTLIPRSLC